MKTKSITPLLLGMLGGGLASNAYAASGSLTYTYDAAGRLTQTSGTPGSQTYTLDAAGNRTGLTLQIADGTVAAPATEVADEAPSSPAPAASAATSVAGTSVPDDPLVVVSNTDTAGSGTQ